MRHQLLIGSLVGSFALTSVAAQEAADEVASEATEAVETAVTAPPGPPPIEVARPASPVESAETGDRFSRYVTPIDYESVRPKPADYPREAWKAGSEGLVEYRLTVDAEGSPTSCHITQSSGHAALDEVTCAVVMERAKFDPARDEDGNPIEGVYEDAHSWRKREPEFPGTMKVHVAFTVDETGRSSDCEVKEISGAISEQMRKSFEREPCPGMNRRARAPYRDEEGNPVARRVELVLSVKVEEPSD